jgi:hypothetical protein
MARGGHDMAWVYRLTNRLKYAAHRCGFVYDKANECLKKGYGPDDGVMTCIKSNANEHDIPANVLLECSHKYHSMYNFLELFEISGGAYDHNSSVSTNSYTIYEVLPKTIGSMEMILELSSCERIIYTYQLMQKYDENKLGFEKESLKRMYDSPDNLNVGYVYIICYRTDSEQHPLISDKIATVVMTERNFDKWLQELTSMATKRSMRRISNAHI